MPRRHPARKALRQRAARAGLQLGARAALAELEVFEDRHGSRSTLLATQLPIDAWRAHIRDPTVAGAILDGLVHNAHRVELTGGSMRKKRSNSTSEDEPAKQ